MEGVMIDRIYESIFSFIKLCAACLIILPIFSNTSLAVADTVPPTIPGNLSANASSSTRVDLTWSASTDLGGGVVAGYDVYRDGAKLKAGVTSTSYSDTQAQPNTQYSYRVDAFDNANPRNKSPKSNTATVTTPASGGGGGNPIAVNFQPASSSTPSGFLKDSGATFTSARGYGWSTAVNTRDRNRHSDQKLDTFIHFDSGTTVTWQYVLANGTYLISLASGDPSYPQGPHHVQVEGITVINNVHTPTNNFVTVTDRPITVADGQLTIRLTRTSSTKTILNYVRITPTSSTAPPPPPPPPPPSGDTESPTIPGNLSANASSSTRVDLTWSASTDLGGGVVAGYDVYRDGAKLKAGVTSTSYSDTQAQPNTQYSYRVDAFDNANPRNKSPKSNTATVTTPASGGGGGNPIAVNFQPASSSTPSGFLKDSGATFTSARGYGWSTAVNTRDRNRHSDQKLDTFIHFDSGTTVTWQYVLANGTYLISLASGDPSYPQGPHHVQVEGITVINNVHTPTNNFVTVTDRPITVADGQLTIRLTRTSSTKTILNYVRITPTSSTAPPPPPPPPPPSGDTESPTIPGNLSANASSSTRVDLTWSASTDLGGGVVAGYDVYRDGAKLKAGVTSTSYSDTQAQPNTQYSYRVDAFDNANPRNKSPKSNTATVTTPASGGNPGSAPTVPPNFTGKAVSHKKIVLWWTSSRDTGGGVVSGYKVFRNGSQIATVTEPHFSDLNLQANATYSYKIAAFDDASPANNSSQTSALSIQTNSLPPSCTGVAILPNDNAVNVIQSRPAGTTFCFKAGTHRLSAPIDTRANDRYIGEPGTILDGQNSITHAFFGAGGPNQQNVTIQGLIIQNFRTVFSNFSTRNAIKAGENWTVENNEIRNNHDTAIHLGGGIRLINNYIHHNGRYGITVGPGQNQNILVEGNEIAHNNTRNLAWSTAGTAKIVGGSTGTTGLTWRNNWIHHNNGHGLHHDYNVGPNIEIDSNRIEGNEGNGIQHEASWGADIHHNVTINNARQFKLKSCFHGGQIRLLMSSNVTIRNNHVESTEESNGICMTDAIGDLTPPASTTLHNVKVLDNTIKLIGLAQTGVVGVDSNVNDLSKNFFDRNAYFIPEPETGVNWTWYIIHDEWQNTGQDPNSTFQAW